MLFWMIGSRWYEMTPWATFIECPPETFIGQRKRGYQRAVWKIERRL